MTTDKDLLRNRFAANLRTYNKLATVQAEICAQLAGMTGRLCPAPVKALEVGAGTGFLTSHLLDIYPGADWIINDIVEEAEKFIAPLTEAERPGGRSVAGGAREYLWGDAEVLSLPQGLDMIASASTIQWFDNIPGFFASAAGALRSGGYLVVSTFGPENFREIKASTGQGLEYFTCKELETALHDSSFDIIEKVEYIKALQFPTPTEVLRHIKATGVNSIEKVRWTKKNLSEFEEAYRDGFSTGEGMVTLTYHPILTVARKR